MLFRSNAVTISAIISLAFFAWATTPPSESVTFVTSWTSCKILLVLDLKVASVEFLSDRVMVSPDRCLSSEGEPLAMIFTVIYYREFPTEPVSFLQILCSQKYRYAFFFIQFLQIIPDGRTGLCVKSCCWLIQE